MVYSPSRLARVRSEGWLVMRKKQILQRRWLTTIVCATIAPTLLIGCSTQPNPPDQGTQPRQPEKPPTPAPAPERAANSVRIGTASVGDITAQLQYTGNISARNSM